ncbi:MAG TPA: DUF4234 domain-containing protein [Nocardioides sp.]|jgi:hypothetical protein|nr:DUF4234 domain-containing protein [Nocardioides sp.]
MCIFLTVITFGIYGLVWYFSTHEGMKRHTGQGMGGGLALVLAIFVGIVMPYITSSEVGSMYERAGMRKPVSGATGLWYFPGWFLLVGPLVWFIKTNSALNAYWRSGRAPTRSTAFRRVASRKRSGGSGALSGQEAVERDLLAATCSAASNASPNAGSRPLPAR